jgi:hypothetical protein
MRRRLHAIALAALFVFWAVAAQALTISGRVLDEAGHGLAGAVISDEIGAVASGKDGAFKLLTEPGRLMSISAPAAYTAPAKWWWPVREGAGQLSLRVHNKQSAVAPQVAFIADPHLFAEKCGPVKYPVPPEIAKRPMDTWNRVAGELGKLGPALTIVAGDLCSDADKGDESHAEAQMALAAQAMARLPGPARAIPGNHDVRYKDGRVDEALWRKYLGPVRQVFFLRGAAFILLDNLGLSLSSKGAPISCGDLPDEAISWVQQILPLIPPDHAIYVVSHYPPLTPISGSNPLHKRSLVRSQRSQGLALRNTDQNFLALAALLAQRKLAGFIHGHEHAAHKSVILGRKPFWVIGLPALCSGWWQGDRRWGPFGFPSAYTLLRLREAPSQEGPDLRLIEVKY